MSACKVLNPVCERGERLARLRTAKDSGSRGALMLRFLCLMRVPPSCGFSTFALQQTGVNVRRPKKTTLRPHGCHSPHPSAAVCGLLWRCRKSAFRFLGQKRTRFRKMRLDRPRLSCRNFKLSRGARGGHRHSHSLTSASV